jgi:hypothetical protein
LPPKTGSCAAIDATPSRGSTHEISVRECKGFPVWINQLWLRQGYVFALGVILSVTTCDYGEQAKRVDFVWTF